MFKNIHSAYGALGTMLGLIALFLLLDKYTGAKAVIEAAGSTTNTIFRTLQGR